MNDKNPKGPTFEFDNLSFEDALSHLDNTVQTLETGGCPWMRQLVCTKTGCDWPDCVVNILPVQNSKSPRYKLLMENR